jgi:hypothetical protein
MSRLVLLCEEPSMKEFLDRFLPRLLPGLDFVCVKHEGKQDLERSIPRKLRGWNDPRARFVIVRDNDGAPCKPLKRRLKRICADAGRPEVLVRLACQELEAWYLGAPEALGGAYSRPGVARAARGRKLRDPDRLGVPSRELAALVPEFRKLDGARRMAEAMPLEAEINRSRSFQVFVDGVRRLVAG